MLFVSLTHNVKLKEEIVFYNMSWCWWCCHDVSGTSLSLPYKYDERLKTFQTCGNFCSWSCMKSYALYKYGLSRGGIICGNMVLMRIQLFKQIGHIKPAPNRFKLKDMGEYHDLYLKNLYNSKFLVVVKSHHCQKALHILFQFLKLK